MLLAVELWRLLLDKTLKENLLNGKGQRGTGQSRKNQVFLLEYLAG
jgi:hypothetical protein